MKQVISFLIVSILITMTMTITSNIDGAVAQMNEPQMGTNYTLNGSFSWIRWNIYVEKGDNVSVIVNQTTGVNWLFGVSGDAYLNSSNDTLTQTSSVTLSGNLSYWIIAADEEFLIFLFETYGTTNITYSFSRINHTVIPDDHSEFQAQLDALNGTLTQLNTTMKDLNTTMGSLGVVINTTKGNVTTLEGEYAILAERYTDIMKNLTMLQGLIDALNISDETNLTEINTSITNLMGYYIFLQENISTLENITVENVTKIIYNNETFNTTVYAYDNGTLKELDSNVTQTIGYLNNFTLDHQKTINDVESLNGKVTDLENRTETEPPTKTMKEDNTWRFINLGFLIVVCIILMGIGYELGRQRKRMNGWEMQQEASVDPGRQSDTVIEEEYLQDYQSENTETNDREDEIIPKVETKDVRTKKR